MPRCDWLVLVACAGGGGRLGEWHGRHVSSGCIGDETMHCFVRSIDFDALSGRVTWVPVICFGIRAICGRDRGSVEGWGRFVVRLGAVGGNEEGGRGCRAGAGCALDCQGRWVRRRRFGWVGRPLKGKKNTNKHRGGSERSGVLSGVRGQGWWRPPCDAGSLLLRNCSNKAFLKPRSNTQPPPVVPRGSPPLYIAQRKPRNPSSRSCPLLS